MRDIALRNLHFRYPATLSAFAAVDRGVHLLSRAPELALHEVVRLYPSAEAQILFPILFAQPPNLNEIGNHAYRVQSLTWPTAFIYRAGFAALPNRTCSGISKSC